ncbi:16S rRNA (guanine(527)-N(7))-methyltransferase RsmG [Candidatus Aerophobetes bacterium]|nr:16S rRNA (guanine(527)-N(7))-methyltransferase RsmG [Candidatus Aerophobetes bacterium]
MLTEYPPSRLLELGAKKLGITIAPEKIEKFLIYLEELKLWNRKINLTSLKSDEEILIKHFLDSLSCSILWKKTPHRLIDIGTGAGFPSLPLKILLPEIKCTLIEAKKKKTVFLEHLIKKLNLEDIRIINARAEDMAREEERESFDLALSRAVAKLNILLEYALVYVKLGGYLIAQKGKDAKEIEEAKNALSILGGQIVEVKHINLPFLNEHRSLILIKKVKSTPLAYPRRTGIPQKRPL